MDTTRLNERHWHPICTSHRYAIRASNEPRNESQRRSRGEPKRIQVPIALPLFRRVQTDWKSKATCVWANHPEIWGDSLIIQTSASLPIDQRANLTVELANGQRLLSGRPKVLRKAQGGLVLSMDGFDHVSQDLLTEIRTARTSQGTPTASPVHPLSRSSISQAFSSERVLQRTVQHWQQSGNLLSVAAMSSIDCGSF